MNNIIPETSLMSLTKPTRNNCKGFMVMRNLERISLVINFENLSRIIQSKNEVLILLI